jgi:hypothetical protein
LIKTNNGATDINRYHKEFRLKEFQLFRRRSTLKQAVLPADIENKQVTSLLSEWMDTGKGGIEVPDHPGVNQFFSSPEFQNELKRRLTLSSERVRSIPNANVKQLIKKAQSAFQKQQFQNASKFFTFAIDKLDLEKPIYKRKPSDQLEMANLFQQKAFCQLKLGENNRSLLSTQSALDDCAFVLETGAFEIDLIKSDTSLFEKFKIIEQDASRLKRSLEEGPVMNQRQRAQAQQREREYQKIKQINSEQFQNVDGFLCSKLAESESKLAINASANEDFCPACMFRWCDFSDPKIAAVLPCNHAICIDCLVRVFKESNAQGVDQQDKRDFCCLLCRLKLSKDTLENVAKAFVNRHLVKTINELAVKLPFDQAEFDRILVKLLLTEHKFDVSDAERVIFNMVGLVDSNPNAELSSVEKQDFYSEARKTVELLHSERRELVSTINGLENTQSEEFREKKKQLKELRKKIEIATENAARDIFERVNSKMMSNLNDGDKCYRIDFHGQHDDLATQNIIKEHVLPILEVVKKIMVITGWGAHSENGKSTLKDSIRAYFTSLTCNHKCEDVAGNKGAFYVIFQD